MALSSAFHERLEHMERTRNHRLSLLQDEKVLQANKSQVLSSKLVNIRALEQRCLILDQKIASQNFKILALKSEIESLDAKYQTDAQEWRLLKSEVEELEELEKERNRFYQSKGSEMKEFREKVESFVVACQMQVEDLRNGINELKSTFTELKGKNRNSSNSEIAAAEARKSELLDAKESLDRNLASNHQIRAQLQKQLQNILMSQDKERRKLSQLAKNQSGVE
ncbi:hypothetical protein O6P43_012976 [Quillaja saponaria]|uniref:Uncharacterized protein n=1 Tax=Quillaja saponaria TaxID=32244 RepID=A0AAD7M2U4_QUISA|nr:hypothetical protein O6P43_012976 [Quillaja saponaria]